MQVAPSSLRLLKGLAGEQSVATELYGTEFQPRVTSQHHDLLRRRQMGLDEMDSKCIDLFVWLRVLILEFREEQSRRRATIRMMFNIALSHVARVAQTQGEESPVAPRMTSPRPSSGFFLKNSGPAASLISSAGDVNRNSVNAKNNTRQPTDTFNIQITGVSMDQFTKIIKLVHPGYPIAGVATLFREAFVLGSGVVDYDSFMAAAEQRQFFSQCIRLPPIMGADRASPFSPEESTQLATVVLQRVTCLDHDLQPWLAQLPPSWAQIVLYAREAIQLEEIDAVAPRPALPTPELRTTSGSLVTTPTPEAMTPREDGSKKHLATANFAPDGRRLLVAYRRYLDILSYMRICNRADRGESGGSLCVPSIVKELDSIESVLRDDPQSLAPDVLTLKRMARSGIPLQLHALLSRPQRGLSIGVMVARRSFITKPDGTITAVTAQKPPASIPLNPPDEGEVLPPEEYAIRLGIDCLAGDPIMKLRTRESMKIIERAAKGACVVKIQRTFKRLLNKIRARKLEGAGTFVTASPPPSPIPTSMGKPAGALKAKHASPQQ
jgi:hypothetical protein